MLDGERLRECTDFGCGKLLQSTNFGDVADHGFWNRGPANSAELSGDAAGTIRRHPWSRGLEVGESGCKLGTSCFA